MLLIEVEKALPAQAIGSDGKRIRCDTNVSRYSSTPLLYSSLSLSPLLSSLLSPLSCPFSFALGTCLPYRRLYFQRNSENRSRKEAVRKALLGDFTEAGLVTSFINPERKCEKLFSATTKLRDALMAGKTVAEIFEGK